jgi:DNA-binding NtrC family response regulator
MKSEKNLLFVDDESEILEILVDLFSEEGYQLHTATRAGDARKILNDHPIDFVLSDMRLPDSSGSSFLDEVRTTHPGAVRVLTSGYLDVQFGQVKEDASNGTFYLSKPWDLSTLKDLVVTKLG